MAELHEFTTASDRETAFQLWAYECGRNASAVARRLGVKATTVCNWAVRGDWAQRADTELAEVLPDLVRQTAINLRLGAYTASRRLLVLLSDEASPLPYKEVDALIKTAAIGGFSAVGKNPLPAIEPGDEHSPPTEDIDKIIDAHHRRLGIAGDADTDDR